MSIKVVSFFSGLGLMDLGFENNGYEILEVIERKKEFLNMYKYARHVNGMPAPTYGYNNEDVEKYIGNVLFSEKVRKEGERNIIGFIGGPPCPDFSVAGKNRGISGDNGRLTAVYFDLILENMPHFFVFENVKGIWKTKKNREYILQEIEKICESGYEVYYDVLNALDFGVPQDRERFILIGINKKKSQDYKKIVDLIRNKIETTRISNEYNWPTRNRFDEDKPLLISNIINKTLTVQYWFEKNNVYKHVNAEDYFKPKAINKFETIDEGDVSGKSFKRLHRWRYSPTAAYGNNEVHLHPYKKRRLSVAEALSIQSAPASFILPRSATLSDKFKAVGNAVPYLMAFHLAKIIKEAFINESRQRGNK